MESRETQDRLDGATSSRLRRLASMPVETGAVEAMLRKELGIEQGGRRQRWQFRPMLALAATLVLGLGTAALLLRGLSQPSTASADELVKFHEELVSGRAAVHKVESVEEASKVLSEQWPEMPALPNMPKGHDMACCMKSVKDKKVACVLLRQQGDTPLTLVVARAADVQTTGGTLRQTDGMSYRIQAVGKLNMLTATRGDRVVCLIGEVPEGKLAAVAAGLKF